MNSEYDKYYETENLFGDPYPELIEYFSDDNIQNHKIEYYTQQNATQLVSVSAPPV